MSIAKAFERIRTGMTTNTTNKLKHVDERKKSEHGSRRKVGRVKTSIFNMRPIPPNTKLVNDRAIIIVDAAAFISLIFTSMDDMLSNIMIGFSVCVRDHKSKCHIRFLFAIFMLKY